MNKLQDIFSYSATSTMDRGWATQGEGRSWKTGMQKLGMNQNPGSNFDSDLYKSFYLREFYLLICVETAIDRTPSKVTDTIF